jgi:hypothetical protein
MTQSVHQSRPPWPRPGTRDYPAGCSAHTSGERRSLSASCPGAVSFVAARVGGPSSLGFRVARGRPLNASDQATDECGSGEE